MSAYLGSGPYTCGTCKEEYNVTFVDERIYKVDGANPEFANFGTCEDCGIKEAIEKLIKLANADKLPFGTFHIAYELSSLLEDWTYRERDKCLNCGHERAGCQYHDG